jgi:hypothetical protein
MDTERFPPVMVMVAITGVSQILVMEDALGMTTGHTETRAVVDRWLGQLEKTTGAGPPKGPGDGARVSPRRRIAKAGAR